MKRVKISLQLFLILPLTLQVVFVSSIVGYLGFTSGQSAVEDVALQLHDEINKRIVSYLDAQLAIPNQLIRMNTRYLDRVGVNPRELELRFLEQVQAVPTVSSVYLGTPQGGLIDAGREGDPERLYLIHTKDYAAGEFFKYETDTSGERIQLLSTLSNFDGRTRPWFKTALGGSGIRWSPVYILFTGQGLAMTVSQAVYDTKKAFVGICAVDLQLQFIDRFLGQLKIAKTGLSFIIDKNGDLIASSNGMHLVSQGESGEPNQRIQAVESSPALIREAMIALNAADDLASPLRSDAQQSFTLDDETYYLTAVPYSIGEGLDWRIVSILPRQDFMAEIDANLRSILVFLVLSIVLIVLVNFVVSRWISTPIRRLNQYALALSRGEFESKTLVPSRIVEINSLHHSFVTMAGELNKTMGSLRDDIQLRLIAEDKVRQTLEEKETLLKELYHRTKNNMSFINALLELHVAQKENPQLREVLSDIQNRIRAMSLVHERLYESGDLSRIDLKDYISELLELLLKSYNLSADDLHVELALDRVTVLIDSALPCGLILHELISNACRYAFGNKDTSTIRIRLTEDESGLITLEVQDDGPGFPPDFDLIRDGKMGLRNVFLLGEKQLKGSVEFLPGKGVHCRLRFKDNHYIRRV